MAKAWESTLRKTQVAAKKRAHSIFGSMSMNEELMEAGNHHNNDDDYEEDGNNNNNNNNILLEGGSLVQVEKYLGNGDYYNGQWYEYCPHGHGKYLWADGCCYVGEWFRGQAIGKGRFSWPSGAHYEGEFKSGYMDGKGSYVGVDEGESFIGMWVMNMKHGYGVMTYDNGDVYEGDWRHGVQDGQGKYQWSNGNCFIGEWRNGLICGVGVLVWTNGNHFEGNWVDSLPFGEGVFKWGDGSYYHGNWSSNRDEMTGGTYHSSRTTTTAAAAAAVEFESESESESADCCDPRQVYNEIVNGSKVCCATEKITVFPSQKKLAPWESSKGIRPGRMSVDSKIKITAAAAVAVAATASSSGHITWENPDSSEGSDQNSHFHSHFHRRSCCVVSARDVDLEGLNIDHYVTTYRMIMTPPPGTPGRPLRIPKAGKRQGQTITRGHRNYELMLNLQLGIRHAVGRSAPPTSLDLKSSAFDPKEKVWTKFPTEGSKYTPPHNSCEFKWKDYCPLVFRALRKLFKVDAADYMLSICGNEALRELSSPGKSGSFFYLSSDDRYMIKTMKKSEVKVLLRMLSAYYNHVRAFENTLVTKFFGLHCVKLTGPTQKKVRFIIMGNLFCTEHTIHRRFDLKGSSLGRSSDKPEEELDASAILKDLDLNFIFRLQKSWFQDFCRQVDRDCEFLEQVRIMDYSLLVGLHFREASKAGDLIPSGNRTPIGDDSDSDQGGPRLSRIDMDQLLIDPAWWASVRLGVNMPAQVERAVRRIEGETQIMEATGEYYDVVMFFGIIDILQDYDISKKLEHAYKAMQYDSASISAVDPRLYSKRFRDFIFRIFMEDNN